MKAIICYQYGSPDLLKLEEIDKPTSKEDEVLVRVYASSINPAEWYSMSALYIARLGAGLLKPKKTRLGTDFAGVVEAVGAQVTQFQPGDEVFGARHGAFAEYVCVGADGYDLDLGIAYHLRGDRAAARAAYSQARSISETIGHIIIHIATIIGLGQIEEADNHLILAAEHYRRALALAGEPPMLVACEAHLELARLYYEWNDLAAAQQHGQQGRQLAQQIELISTFGSCELLLAHVKLAHGDLIGATMLLAQVEQYVRRHHFVTLLPKVIAVQQHDLAAAAQLGQAHELPLSQVQVYLAQGDPAAALAVLEAYRRQVETKDWADERLKLLVLQALAHDAHGEKELAVQHLYDALALAEAAGFIRLFVEQGAPMAELLTGVKGEDGRIKLYIEKVLAAFGSQETVHLSSPILQPLIEPLSQRELEVLHLIAQGLSNQAISERLFLALSTVKGHNRVIFDKLQVQRRREAVARARALGLI